MTWKAVWMVLLAALAAVMCALGCFSTGPDDGVADGGSGSEIVGAVQYPDSSSQAPSPAKRLADTPSFAARSGIPAVGAMIYIYPKSFVPDSTLLDGGVPRAYTDSQGRFHLSGIPRGTYVLEASDGAGKASGRELTVSGSSADTLDIGVLYLEAAGAARVRFETSLPGPVLFFVSVKGTRHIVRGTSAGVDITMDNLPVGEVVVHVKVVEPGPLEFDIPAVTISAGLTTALQTIRFP